MNLEIKKGLYNEAGSNFDITHWAIGERSRKVAELDPSLREARSRFSAVSGSPTDAPAAIFLPGTLGPADITFGDQIRVLQELGLNVNLVDYSDSRFSSEMLRAQLTDFINSFLVGDKKINLVGFSLGTGSIFDLLFRENEIRQRIPKVVLEGSVFSSHDLANLAMRNAGKIPKPITMRGTSVLRALARIDGDPALTPDEVERTKKADREVSRRAFAERVVSFLKERERIEQYIRRYGQIEGVEALLIRWQKDFASEERYDAMAQAFKIKPTIVTVDGQHGDTSSSAAEIKEAIVDFLAP